MDYGEDVGGLVSQVVEDGIREAAEVRLADVFVHDGKGAREGFHLLKDTVELPLKTEIEVRDVLSGVPVFGR